MRKHSSSFFLRKSALIILLAPLLSGPAIPQQKLTAAAAKEHIGETATVCGNVASTRYASLTEGQPTFINLDKPYPGQIFTILIWGSNRHKFGAPETDYRNKRVCVTGKIEEFRRVPEVVVSEPRQLRVESEKLSDQR